jgi:hypothetical protein
MKSVMKHSFSKVPSANIPRSMFNRPSGYKTTFDAGYLIPFFCDEALPGDTFNVRVSAFARLATPVAPIMDNMYMDFHFFAVPVRLIWDNWQRFNGEQPDPAASTDFTVPTMTSPGGGYAEQSLSDYMGIPTKIASLEHSALWHRAYNLCWNEWFRDQNLQNSVVVDTGDAASTPGDYVLLRRGKRHDYFTSCLPWPQKGTAVELPLGTGANVVRDANAPAWNVYNANAETNPSSGDIVQTSAVLETTSVGSISLDPQGGLTADLSTATAATINQLRQAFQIQKLYERDARGGTRYTEIVRSHFGVISPDQRLQRPELLGVGTTPIHINPVAQTSETNTTAQGNLAAFGTSSISGVGFKKSFTEHCILIGLVSTRADLTYQQGLNRMWSRSTRWDFYWPALSHIGEQAVLNKEIYAQGTSADDDVFGYQERYAEYKYKPSLITGQFRSNATTSLDVWHLSQDFSTLPVLNDTFIQDNPPVDRVIVTATEPHFLFDSYIDMKTARPMPMFSVPGMIDHF